MNSRFSSYIFGQYYCNDFGFARFAEVSRALSRAKWLVGCSLAALIVALEPVAAEDMVPQHSPSTIGLTAADFDTPEYRADWGLGRINAATAYARGFTGSGVLVAVVDSGIDATHPEFRDPSHPGLLRISPASGDFYDWLSPPNPPFPIPSLVDRSSHGTHVSGTIGAARDGVGMMGVAFDSTILTLRAIVGNEDQERYPRNLGGDTAAAIDRATAAGARVLNGSYGPSYGDVRKGSPLLAVIPTSYEANEHQYEAIKRAADTDMLLVFAAGNSRQHQPVISRDPFGAALYPYISPRHANSGVYQLYDEFERPIDQSRIDFSSITGSIVTVVAIDKNNRIAAFSNLCGVTADWCLAAPGVAIDSTVPGGGYASYNGTSMAAPHVTGAAAVLRQAFPFLTAPQIAQTLFTTATHLGDGPADAPNATYGWGLLNLGKAIDGPGQFTRDWTVNTTYKGQAYDGTFANDISGVGGLTKIGRGTLELTGTNSYAGGTNVYGGILAVAHDANLGAAGGGLTLGNGGILQVRQDGFTTARLVSLDGLGGLGIDRGSAIFGGVIADGGQPGTLGKFGSGTAVLTAANTYTGGTAVMAGTLALTATGRLVSPVFVTAGARFANAGFVFGHVTNGGFLGNTGQITGGVANGGSLTNGGSIVGGLVNARLAYTDNAGTITGGVSNAGLLLSTGTIAGAVANAGFLGNAGAITGAVLNAGWLSNSGAITGAVTSTGILGNAGTITGAVANSGTLGNAGRISGAVANAGWLSNGGAINGGVANTGTLGNAGTITGAVSNAGWLVNGGAIGGGVTNMGSLSTGGTIAGGLTNAGTVLASAGRIDGAIRNDAGLIAVSGAVASNGTFVNAAGAALAVSGAYNLAGPLTNAGTVTVARTASLTAAAGLRNAGLVASDGTLTTDLTNTGTARLSGQFNGVLLNQGLLQIAGPLAGLNTLTNAGVVDLGGNALTLASLSGTADAVLGNGALTVAGPANAAYAGAVLESTRTTSLTKAGSGTLVLSGLGRFSGPTIVQAGTLSLNGFWASPVTVAAAGTLRGIGTVAAPVTVAGAVRPGNSPGTLTVLGPVAFTPGSSLGLDIDGPGTGTGAGSYARLLALGPTGAVSANGTLVPVLRGITGNATNSFTPALGQRFGVLAAQGGLTGSFNGLAQPAGLATATRFDALYGSAGLDLVVTPVAYGNLASVGLAQTGNAQAVGAALDIARPAAGTRPDAARARLFDPLYAANPATLPGGLASLSGQSYGDALMADLAARRLVADTIDRHLRGQGGGAASFSAGDSGLGPNRSALQLRGAAGAPDQPLASGDGRIWADALYGFGSRAGDRAAAGADLDAGGLLLGVDRQIGADALVGGAFSYLRAAGASRGAGFGLGHSTTDSYGGTLYSSARFGALVLRGAAGGSYADGRIDRTVALGASVSRARGLAAGWDTGVSGFAGYALATGLPAELVPEMGFSYERLMRGRTAERGGLASQTFTTADLDGARSLVGGRLASLAVDGTAGLRLEGRAYWAHELGDTAALVRSSLFGVPFATRTSALGRDGAVLGVTLTGQVAEGVSVAVSYTGDVRPGAAAQALSAGLQGRW